MRPNRMIASFLFAVLWIGNVGCSSINFVVEYNTLLEDEHPFVDYSKEDALLSAKTPPNPDEFLTAPELIRKYGYPVEVHHVTTFDGYILELHRIPYGKNSSGSNDSRPVVYIQHGLLSSSADWILNRVDKALPYMLADRGYDVWLGNARGNQYSKNHTSLNADEKEYWQFSYHEMAIYDLPAAFDYVLFKAQKDSMYYIGHSMGTTMFFVCMSAFPDYNAKIKLMVAMGPAVYLNHMRSVVKYLAPLSYEEKYVLDLFGHGAILPKYVLKYLNEHAPEFCSDEMRYANLCENLFYVLAGFDKDQANMTELPVILAHTPNSASTKTLVHFLQAVRSGKFQQYDYGYIKNRYIYGQWTPPQYDLTKVTAPVLIVHGPNDLLVDPQDVARFAQELPLLVDNLAVNLTSFNHIDFLFAKDIDVLVNKPVLHYLNAY